MQKVISYLLVHLTFQNTHLFRTKRTIQLFELLDFLKEALYSTVQVFLCDPLKYFKLCK